MQDPQEVRNRRATLFLVSALSVTMAAGCTGTVAGGPDPGTGSSGTGGKSTTGGTGSSTGSGSGSSTGSGTGSTTGTGNSNGTGSTVGTGNSGTGSSSGSGTGGTTVAACAAGSINDPGLAISRRLTRLEYNNTVRDLVGDTTQPASADSFPSEEISHSFDNNPSVQTVAPVLAEAYFETAEKLAATAVKNNMATLVPCAASAGRTCGQQFVQAFGTKALRRPLATEEVTRYMKVFDTGATTDFASGIRLVITAMLQAESFLYRVEFGAGKAGTSNYNKLTSYEMASRLSYLLWKTMPDATLLTAAANDQLQTAEQIETQARRMLGDTKLRATAVDFHDQWLNLRKLESLEKDKTLFAGYTATVGAEMRTEVAKFVEEALFGATPNASLLFTSNQTFLNKNLATFYGLSGPTGTTFQKVTVDAKRAAGVLTLGGIMAVNAKLNQTSPVLRGKLIREQVLCEHLPPPPGDVNIQVPAISSTATTRERFTQHQADPACSACHLLMDPIGLGFENYDAVGKWRDTENSKTVDASGEIRNTDVPGTFNGPAELGKKLAQSSQVRRCMVTNWFRYSFGREETSTDACTISALDNKFSETKQDVRELIVALTKTDAFMYRRGNN